MSIFKYSNYIYELSGLAFGGDVDFAQLTKIYTGGNHDKGRYSPPKIREMLSKVLTGKPNTKKISTPHVERQNLTMRMQMRRFTRLTNGFSKKVENLKSAVALHFAHYNFMRDITGDMWFGVG